uniref:UBA domain-containing protein n=1 Tax=Oryza glaberrima TaxID=4538 RepID=I1QLP2_ORYGL
MLAESGVGQRSASLLGGGDCKRSAGDEVVRRSCSPMATPQLDKRILSELELMGFPTARSIRALHFSGNSSLESAINWLLEHENDPDIDQLPLIPREINIECGDTPNEARNDIQGMRANAQESKPEESTAAGRQKETSQVERELNADQNEDEVRRRIIELFKSKQDGQERERGRIRNQLQEDKRERIRAAKDLMEAKRTLEENQRKCVMESRKADQEEEKRARERIRKRIEDDKAERRRRLGLPMENPVASVPTLTPTKIKPVEPAVSPEQLRDCLRNLKKNYKDDTTKVTRAFQILLKIIANIVKNPEEEKFRRIRLNNPVFKERVGDLQGGVEFLELCGFMKLAISGYLVMPRDKINLALLNAAGVEVASAMENPYFGLLSNLLEEKSEEKDSVEAGDQLTLKSEENWEIASCLVDKLLLLLLILIMMSWF